MGEERGVLIECGDELDAEWQSSRSAAARQRDAGHAKKGPDAVEEGIASRTEPLRRFAPRAWCEQEVESAHQVGELAARIATPPIPSPNVCAAWR
jgi:hypothetical protein